MGAIVPQRPARRHDAKVPTLRAMALHPHAIHNPPLDADARSAKQRRWCWAALVIAILLGAYAGTLAWVTKRVEAGVERSIQPLPVVMQDRPPDGG